MKNYIYLINEYAEKSSPTGQLIDELKRELSQDGTSTKCVTGFGKYKPGGLNPVRLLNLIYLHLCTLLITFSATARKLVLRNEVVIIVGTSPPLVHLTAIVFGSLFNLKVVTWYFDAHPELEARICEKKNLFFIAKLLRSFDEMILKKGTAFIALDKSMGLLLQKKGVALKKIVISPPWTTYFSPPKPLRAIFSQNNLKLLYAGNYGVAHDLRTLAEILRSEIAQSIELTFVGISSSAKAELELLFKHSHAKISFAPRFEKREDLMIFMNGFDLGIVSLNEFYLGIACPSKAFSYLSMGLPILYVGPESTLTHSLIEKKWGIATQDLFSYEHLNLISQRNGEIFPDPKQDAIDSIKLLLKNL